MVFTAGKKPSDIATNYNCNDYAIFDNNNNNIYKITPIPISATYIVILYLCAFK